jgi:hypothetical protein
MAENQDILFDQSVCSAEFPKGCTEPASEDQE